MIKKMKIKKTNIKKIKIIIMSAAAKSSWWCFTVARDTGPRSPAVHWLLGDRSQGVGSDQTGLNNDYLLVCLFFVCFLFVLLVCDCPPAIGGEQAGLRFQLLDQQVSQSLNLNIYSRGLLNGLNMAKVANFKNPLFISIVIVNNLFHLKTDAQKWSRGWHNCFVDGAYVTPFISMFVYAKLLET